MKELNLTTGSVFKNIAIVSVPLIVSSAINMLYNFTDMYWISSVGPEAVSSVGTTALLLWLSASVIMIVNLGTQIEVSYAKGQEDHGRIKHLIVNSLKYSFLVGLAVGVVYLIFAPNIISFFKIETESTFNWAVSYLRICSLFVITSSLNQTFSSIYNGLGDSKQVLYYMGIGMVANIFLDPFFIKVLDMGVEGAAIATLLASLITLVLFARSAFKAYDVKGLFSFDLDGSFVSKVTKMGFFPTIQNILFSSIAMVLTRIISGFGDQAIAISRVGNDIEALTWMVGIGISTAIGVFVGQNISAGQKERAVHATNLMLGTMSLYGIGISLFFVFGGSFIYELFFDDPTLIALGHNYLMFAALTQVFVIVEQVITGVLNGYQKTNIAPIFSITGNFLRIPLAIVLSQVFGLNGIWIAIGISSIFKGVGILIAYIYLKKSVNLIENN